MWVRTGLAAGFLLVWLIVLLPLKAVVMLAGDRLDYADVYGTVWDGRIYDLTTEGVPLREVRLQTHPLGWLSGRLVADWQVSDPELRGRGEVALGGGGWTLSRTDVSVTLDRLDAPDLPGLDRGQFVQLRLAELAVDEGGCRRARGDARTGALTGFAASQGFEGPVLTGMFDCRDGRVVLDFAGQSADLDLSGEAVFEAQALTWTLTARTGRAELADALALAGLQRDGDAWRGQGRRAYADR